MTVNGTVFWIATAMAVAASAQQPAADPPNIVFIYIDDLGYRDVGFMGSKIYQTPHVDRLAAEGMVFTSGYAAAPNCAPSRASLMSGQYAPRHGIYTVGQSERGPSQLRRLIPTPNQTVLSPNIVTLAEALQSAGYVTGHFGKWHLGAPPNAGPSQQGFDVNIGGNQTGSPAGGHFSPYRNPQLPNPPQREYLTDRLTDEAIRFMRQHANDSFFVYLSHYAVHTPIQAKSEIIKKYAAAASQHGFIAEYAAMIDSVDQSVGRIMSALKELDIDQQTMLVFYSDNGGHGKITSLAPLRGCKGTLYEGGIRVPLAIRWPGTIPPGTRSDTPVCGIDFYPTFLELTGAEPPKQPLDGVSLVPLLRGEKPQATLPVIQRDALFWHFPAYLQGKNYPGTRDPDFRTRPCSVIRQGDWKLIQYFEDDTVELFDLSKDVGENNECSAERPDIANRLRLRLVDWQQSIGAPIPDQPNPEFAGQQ